jgi:hypothetical protein
MAKRVNYLKTVGGKYQDTAYDNARRYWRSQTMRLPTIFLISVLGATAAAALQSPTQIAVQPVAQSEAIAGQSDAAKQLQAADTNKDGKWDKAEWLAAGRRDRGFDFLDADKDGFVTPMEIKAGMAKIAAMRSGQ